MCRVPTVLRAHQPSGCTASGARCTADHPSALCERGNDHTDHSQADRPHTTRRLRWTRPRAQMPPRAAAAARAVIDSSDEDEQPRHPDAKFDPSAILHAVVRHEGHNPDKSVQAHMPSFFSDGRVEREWRAWAAKVPTALSMVTQRALPLKMPMKYTETPQAAGSTSTELQRQVPLMTYANPDDGTRYGKEERRRDYVATVARTLRVSDIADGSTVAIVRRDEDPNEPAGYGTPFYIADIRSYTTIPTPEDAADGTCTDPHIATLNVHYRMPRHKNNFVNDVQRPYQLACWGLHTWDPGCERRAVCVAARPSGATRSAMEAVVDVDTVFEVNLQLVKSGALSKKARESILQRDRSWREALGLQEAESGKKGATGKRNRL